MMKVAVLLILGMAGVIGANQDHVITAQAIIMTNSQLGISQRLGTVTFVQSEINGTVRITGELSFDNRRNGVTRLGMHIHAFGNLTLGCDSTGAHFNPTNQNHGSRTEYARHVGDLGNLVITSHRAVIDITDDIVQLTGPHSVIGRALVIHQGEDDLGKGGDDESLRTGNAGKRWACGVIGLTSDLVYFADKNGSGYVKFPMISVITAMYFFIKYLL